MRKESLLIIIASFFHIMSDPASSILALSVKTSIFYYPWYGNSSTDSHWIHWSQNGHSPPNDIGANFYPTIGAYSSRDTSVLFQHMNWLQSANVAILVTSWWGQGSREDKLTRNVLDAARDHGIKVAFHIEPYDGRTADSTKADIQYIYANYGGHSAFLKQIRATKWGPTTAARGVFYIFESLKVLDASWAQMLDSIRGTSSDAIVLGQTTDISQIDTCHLDGLYTYDTFNIDGSIFKALSDEIKQNNSIFSASVGPGYVDTRAVPGSNRNKLRQNGTTYDTMWQYAINAQVEEVSITSFNEWHEGSQIEPATVKSIGDYDYMNYEGAYGKTGTEAQKAYLSRTAYWIHLYEG